MQTLTLHLKVLIRHIKMGLESTVFQIRQVSIEDGDSKARELGVIFIETSAKAGFNIKVTHAKDCIL